MAQVIINQDACKGCGLCTTACPKKIVHLSKDKLNVKGFHPAEVTEQDQCIGCCFCATICPDVVIRVKK